MNIYVNRFVSDTNTTISRIFVDEQFVCFGLEDGHRERKVPGETRIPAGTYPVTLRRRGRFHSRYSSRFSDIHNGMLHIRKVPGFRWVLIHCGNTDNETNGCLLVGYQASVTPGRMSIYGSTAAYRDLYFKVLAAAAHEELQISFEDQDL